MSTRFWQRPFFVLLCGALIVFISLGIRNSFGLFMRPLSLDMGWGREALSLALATQALLIGAAAPFAGMLADRWGTPRVMMLGGATFALGVFLMAQSTTPTGIFAAGGLLGGVGLGACGLPLILAAVAQVAPESKRSLWLGIVAAGGVGGQLVLIPMSQFLLSSYNWTFGLTVLALMAVVIIPLAYATSGAITPYSGKDTKIGLGAALKEAALHRGFWLLTLGFFVCGFQVQFMSVHLPAFVADQGLGAKLGAYVLMLIAVCNMVSAPVFGYLGGLYSKKNLLSGIYLGRAVVIYLFISLPVTTASVISFTVALGMLWLCTIPLTVGLVAQMFGVRYMGVLYGITFFSHQVGSFSGVWLGGRMFDATGSYATIWWVLIVAGVIASLLHMPINEQPIQRFVDERP
jgi:MFS family permease